MGAALNPWQQNASMASTYSLVLEEPAALRSCRHAALRFAQRSDPGWVSCPMETAVVHVTSLNDRGRKNEAWCISGMLLCLGLDTRHPPERKGRRGYEVRASRIEINRV